MIDHTGHPHPSTPKARALCRANGGTGFIGKIGGHAPTANKKDNDKKPYVPHGPVNTTPKTPKPPSSPAVKKGPTVPKDHGEPKKPTPERKKPTAAPVGKDKTPVSKSPEPLPVPGERRISPGDFNPETMEVRGLDGTWQKVARVESGSSAAGSTLTFLNQNGRVITSVSRSGLVSVRTKQPDPNTTTYAGRMPDFIPPAVAKGPNGLHIAKIQNALRTGASRDFIKSRSKLSADQVDAEIDKILIENDVPNYVYPRKGTGAKPPSIKDVKPPKESTVTARVEAGGDVSTPTVPNSVYLDAMKSRIRVDDRVKAKVDRVLKVQAGQVGSKIARIRGVDSKLPPHDSPQGKAMGISAGTLAACTAHGHIHLNPALHAKDKIIEHSRQSGWFVQGGADGVENTIAHEVGHALASDTGMTGSQRKRLAEAMVEHLGLTIPFGSSNTWYRGLIDKVVQHPANKQKIKRRVSKYAGTNIEEFIAEVWTDFTMNPKPKPANKAIGQVLKEIISEGAN